jgi:hypothetical protein
MKIPLLLLALGLGLAAGRGYGQEYVYMLSAGEMRGAIDQGNGKQAVAYIAGVMDTMMRNRDFCVPASSTPGEIGGRAYRIMALQPRESMAPAADVIAVFLHSDYPCPK